MKLFLIILVPLVVYFLMFKFFNEFRMRDTSVSACMFLAIILLVNIVDINYFYVFLLITGFPFFFLKGDNYESKSCQKKDIFIKMLVAILAFIYIYQIFQSGDFKDFVSMDRISKFMLLISVWVIDIFVLTISLSRKFSFFENKADIIYFSIYVISSLTFVIVCAYATGRYNSYSIIDLLLDKVIQLNGFYLFLTTWILHLMLGSKISYWMNIFIYLFLIISNYIKLRYHGTFFEWLDLYQVKEMILIGIDFVNAQIIVFSLFAIIIFILILRKIRKLIGTTKPKLLYSILSLILIISFTIQIINDGFYNIGIYNRTWENVTINVSYNGIVGNLILNSTMLSEIVMDVPGEYGEEKANELISQFNSYSTSNQVNDIRPDVILILAESLFDMEDVSGIQISKDIDSTLDQYQTTAMISPRYGGYTSAVEFEVLTGLSLSFMPDSLTPFTTYFNNPTDTFPCVIQNFKENGYITKVIHPNLPDFYNRTIVYENMGFDEYQDRSSFDISEENTTVNGWIKDEELGERIINELNANDSSPKFIYGITMEDHYVNQEKYDSLDVEITSDVLSDSEKHEFAQQAESYLHFDAMVNSIIEYMNTTNRPTLLYIFGDHLPPIDALEKLGYTEDLINKYKTRLITYSNYSNINFGTDYITPNQIAAQMVIDSGIKHYSYYDYIYDFRKFYPILHKEFVNINSEDFDIYKFIQYDILFGNRYLAD